MQLVGAWLVWVADQSEAGFGEAQLEVARNVRHPAVRFHWLLREHSVHTHSGKGWGVAWLGRQGGLCGAKTRVCAQHSGA